MRKLYPFFFAVFFLVTCVSEIEAQSYSDIELKEMAVQNQENWRALKIGMDEGQVKLLLGPPGRVTNGPFTSWSYPKGGEVTFSGSALYSWQEPTDFMYTVTAPNANTENQYETEE